METENQQDKQNVTVIENSKLNNGEQTDSRENVTVIESSELGNAQQTDTRENVTVIESSEFEKGEETVTVIESSELDNGQQIDSRENVTILESSEVEKGQQDDCRENVTVIESSKFEKGEHTDCPENVTVIESSELDNGQQTDSRENVTVIKNSEVEKGEPDSNENVTVSESTGNGKQTDASENVTVNENSKFENDEPVECRENDPIVAFNDTDTNIVVEAKSTDLVHPDAKKKLQELIENKGIIDYTLDIESATAKGDNYSGVIAKATIRGKTGSGNSISLNWIIKSSPSSEIMRSATKVDLTYRRESFMYEKVFPYFLKFHSEKTAIDHFDFTAPFVMSYLEPPKETLAMQDMKSLGYIMEDRKRPLDYNHAKLVMKAYGKLHAISFALKDQRPEEFKILADEARECMCTRGTINIEELMQHNDRFNAKILKSLDPIKDARACEIFKKYANSIVDITLDTMELTHASPYSVIGHGDSWVNNMLFKYDNPYHPENPTKVCLLDWQLARYGSPAFDLSYFIFTCTDKPLRDKYYDKLIKVYYYSLCSHLVDLGSNPEKLITFENLQAELKRYSFIGMQMSTLVIYLMLSEAEEVPDFSDMKSQDEVIRAFTFESKNESAYLERVRGMVVDFVEKGYLDLF